MPQTQQTMVHTFVVVVVDHNALGSDEIQHVLENTVYSDLPQYNIQPYVKSVKTEEVSHPLITSSRLCELMGLEKRDPT